MAAIDADVARIILERADRFYEAAQLQQQNHAPAAEIEANLSRAVASYQRALTFYTQASYPTEFAHIQTSLGTVFMSLAEIKDPETNLGQAIQGFTEVLAVYTRGSYPANYAMIQNNLGNAYGRLAQIARPELNLERAIQAHSEALEIYTPLAFPVQHAVVSFHLGQLYRQRGDLALAEGALAQAEQVARRQGMVRWAEQALTALDAVREETSNREQ